MRIPPVVTGTRPELAQLEASIATQRGRVSPLYQVLLNSPPMAHGWEQLLTAVRRHNTLDAIDRELIIVRVAALNDARFEYEAHVPIALAAGATQASIDTVSDPARTVDGLADATRALIDLTDAMTRDIRVPDEIYARVRNYYTERQVVDAMVTIGAYNMVSRFLEALHIGH
ncbi:MAG: carboxymuconolactone decarboxylase family protein [Lysobacteraceae bacterium]|nr:MAG: carboxymuconolactone decarboxylase family protein [Xanthomonadaceae bacterium]